LSNAYWPFVWPSPEAGVLTVTGGSLDLPVLEGSVDEWVPPPAETAEPAGYRRHPPHPCSFRYTAVATRTLTLA